MSIPIYTPSEFNPYAEPPKNLATGLDGLGQATETRAYLVGPALSTGDQGTAVLELQQDLINLGFDPGPRDGIYGPQTANAVKTFQRTGGRLVVDGIFGPNTRDKLRRWMLEERGVQIVAPTTDSGGGDPPPGAGGGPSPTTTALAVGGVALTLALITYSFTR